MAAALPWVFPQFPDDNGDPIPGGKVYIYLAGTSTPTASYTDSTGTVPNTNPVILDGAGRADIWLAPGSYKIVLKDANDVVVKMKDKVKPADGGGGGIVDSDYAVTGFSSRFNEFFDVNGLQTLLTQLMSITYTGPAISLSASGSTTIREKGTVVSSTLLTATVTKRSDPINLVRFYKGATLIDTENSGGAIPNGGSSVFTYSATPFSDTTSFSAEADDDGTSGGPTTVTAGVTFTFVYPYYHGAGAAALSAASVGALTKTLIVSTATVNKTITANGSQKMYFAYPASYGALTSILDVNGFDTFPDWTLRTENITGLDGNAVSYRIYEFNNTAVAGDYFFSFKR